MTRHSALIAAALLAACSAEQPAEDTSLSATPSPSRAVDGRSFKYTSLKDCPVLESNADEAGYFLSECPGEGGYKLQVTESDLRQTIAVIAPGGAKARLDLAAITGGGFSELGDTVEWRGPVKDGVFTPDALILRHEVVTDPEGEDTVSYLVTVKLPGTPCAIAKIPPRADQNEQARDVADAQGPCLAS